MGKDCLRCGRVFEGSDIVDKDRENFVEGEVCMDSAPVDLVTEIKLRCN